MRLHASRRRILISDTCEYNEDNFGYPRNRIIRIYDRIQAKIDNLTTATINYDCGAKFRNAISKTIGASKKCSTSQKTGKHVDFAIRLLI